MHILLALLVIVAANYLALRGLRRLRRGRQAALSVLVSVDAVLAVLLVLELGMSLFFAQSDGFNITLASRTGLPGTGSRSTASATVTRP